MIQHRPRKRMEPLDEVIDGLPETEHRLGRVYRRIEVLERKAQRLREDPVEPEDAERADRFDREAAKLRLRLRDESDELVDFASPNSRDATEGVPNAPGAAGEPVLLSIATHRTASRRDDLAPAIDAARARASDPTDHAAVWVSFVALADSPERPLPLLGFAENEVKYRAGDDVKCIGRGAFMKRLKRAAKRR